MSETKEQVFEALLKDSQFDLKWWLKRYEKAERFGRGHDVDDLYEVVKPLATAPNLGQAQTGNIGSLQ